MHDMNGPAWATGNGRGGQAREREAFTDFFSSSFCSTASATPFFKSSTPSRNRSKMPKHRTCISCGCCWCRCCSSRRCLAATWPDRTHTRSATVGTAPTSLLLDDTDAGDATLVRLEATALVCTRRVAERAAAVAAPDQWHGAVAAALAAAPTHCASRCATRWHKDRAK